MDMKSWLSSIKVQVLLLVLFVAAILLSMLVTMAVRQRRYFSAYDRLISVGARINSVQEELSAASQSLENLVRSQDPSFVDEMIGSLSDSLAALRTVENAMRSGEETALYYRVLDGMVSYALEDAPDALTVEEEPEARFAEVQYYRMWSLQATQIAQELTTAWQRHTVRVHSELRDQATRLLQLLGVLVLLSVLIVVVVALLGAKRIYRPLVSIAGFAESLANHQWDTPELSSSRDPELGRVIRSLNRMRIEIVSHLETMRIRGEAAEREQLWARTQLLALQAQLKPHFLFNALETVRRTISSGDASTAREMLESLSRILRYVLETPGSLVPFSQEMGIVRDYVAVQKARFGERILVNVSNTIEDDYLVPPFSVQVLVENAIDHGLKEQQGTKKVEIDIGKTDEMISITVRDNGAGMSTERLETLRAQLASDTDLQTSRIGLANLYLRLKRLFGPEFSFGIDSKAGQGTEVTIRMRAMVGE
jgi:sensor histidine kinase YesM